MRKRQRSREKVAKKSMEARREEGKKEKRKGGNNECRQ